MKFLDTNLSIEQFVAGLNRTVENLPEVLADWQNLPTELQEEYLDQLCWVLTKTAEFIEQHNK